MASQSFLFYEERKRQEKESAEKMRMLHQAFRLSLDYPDAPITRKHFMDGKMVDLRSNKCEYETSNSKIAQIYRIVIASSHPTTVKRVSEKTGFTENLCSNSLTKLVNKNMLQRQKGHNCYLYWKP